MTCKPYDIPKTLIWEAWLHVKANQGAAGIDAETIERFEKKLGDNLYKLWNRMSSGSYVPPPVKAVQMRVGLYRPVHVKTLRSQKLRMLLTHRKLLQSKAIAIENDLRGTLHNFGLKVGMVGTVKFEARIKELVENLPDLAVLVEPLLVVRRRVLREQFVILHRRLLAIVRDDEVCRRLMTTPGVGPVVALTYRATVGVPARFRKSKAVGAVFGLTCSKYQSGET
jgi:transposase